VKIKNKGVKYRIYPTKEQEPLKIIDSLRTT